MLIEIKLSKKSQWLSSLANAKNKRIFGGTLFAKLQTLTQASFKTAQNTLTHSHINTTKTFQFSYYPIYTKNIISVRPKIRLQQDESVQVQTRGTNLKD